MYITQMCRRSHGTEHLIQRINEHLLYDTPWVAGGSQAEHERRIPAEKHAGPGVWTRLSRLLQSGKRYISLHYTHIRQKPDFPILLQWRRDRLIFTSNASLLEGSDATSPCRLVKYMSRARLFWHQL